MKNLIITLTALLCFNMLSAQTWNQISVPTSEKLNDIDFPSPMVGYISGDNETLLKSIDGGENWMAIVPIGIVVPFTYHIGDLEFVDENIGFCNVPNAGQTYKTIDGGVNWTLVDDVELGNFCYRNAIYANSENQFFLGGAGCFQSAMIKEYNAGVWSEKTDNLENFNSSEFVNQFDFLNQLGIAATNSNYMLRSVDGGQIWDTIPTPLSVTGTLTSVVIKDALTMYAGYNENGGGFGILTSIDGGLTWTQDINSATFFYPIYWSVAVASNGHVYSGAQPSSIQGGLMFDTPDGINWNYESVDQAIYAIDSYGLDNTFAVGDSGYVISNVLFSSLGIVEENPEQINVFPNPTSADITISFPSISMADLELTDMLGKTVLNVSEFKSGDYLHTEELNTGRYLLNIKTQERNYNSVIIKQ